MKKGIWNCKFCNERHQSPENGFPINKFAKNHLQFGLNMKFLNFNQFIHCKKTIDGLNKDLKEIEALRNDPENYISDYFDELTRQVDIRRETLLKEIHEYSDELIQKIAKLKQDCFDNSKNPSITTKTIDEIKTKLNSLNIMLDSLELGDKQHKEIMYQNLTNEIARLMQPILKQYKFELHGNKSYVFEQAEIKKDQSYINKTNQLLTKSLFVDTPLKQASIKKNTNHIEHQTPIKTETTSISMENIFGILNDFDYDIDNPFMQLKPFNFVSTDFGGFQVSKN